MRVPGPITSLTILFCFYTIQLAAQECAPDYLTVNFTTPTVQQTGKAIFNTEGGIDIPGSVLRKNSILIDGMLTRITKQGTVLWSRAYSSANYDYVQFYNAVPLNNGETMVTGSFATVDTSSIPPAILASTGFLTRIDRQGNIKWTRLFDNIFNADAMIKLQDGNIVVSFTGRKDVPNTILLCFDADANIKWSKTIQWRTGDLPGVARMLQLNNGDLLIGQRDFYFDVNTPSTPAKNGYYMHCLDGKSGLRKWEHFYWLTFSNDRSSFGDVSNIIEYKNGSISLVSSFADTAYYLFRTTKNIVNLQVDSQGRLASAFHYASNKPPIFSSDAAYDSKNDRLVILMDNADSPFLMGIDTKGQLLWNRSYGKVGRSQETTSLLSSDAGYYFFCFTHNGGSKELSMTKTDTEGKADCVETVSTFTAAEATSFYQQADISLTVKDVESGWYSVSAISKYDYGMQSTIICKQTCCADVTTYADPVDLCNATEYLLPNAEKVTSSGIYPVQLKSVKGCDSIVYYDVTFSKKPDIDLNSNYCLADKDSLILKVNPAYAIYFWNGVETSSPWHVVKMPGDYIVSVTNACGTSADTTKVYKECSFAITMPGAFTPNRDGKNDIFRVPAQVSNKLLRLAVFDRWGNVVFSTSDINRGWDGMYKGNAAPAGTYVYIVEMLSLDGKKKINQKGTIILIR